jgi:hypothetical protein
VETAKYSPRSAESAPKLQEADKGETKTMPTATVADFV